MFSRLILENFKPWERAELKFGRITGVFGTNSSGKTSLLQFLLLMKQTKDATDRALALSLGGPYVTVGAYREFVHKNDETRKLKWILGWDQREDISLIDPTGKRTEAFAVGHDFEVRSEIESVKGAARARLLRYRFGDFAFSLTPKGSDPSAFSLSADGGFKFRRTQGRAWTLPGPVKSYGFPDQARAYYQNAEFLAQLVAAFETQMDRTFYLGPLREYPRREYVWTRSRPSDVGPKGERAIEAIISATQRNERRNLKPKARLRPFQEVVAHWLREMGLIYDFRVEEIRENSNLWQAKVVVRKDAPEVLLTDVGFGVSQVLPVLTLLHYVDEGSTVILEQPEIHLHPLAQAGLADVLVNVAQHRGIQIILESHSEHLLLRLQRRVAEEAIAGDFVKLYFAAGSGSRSELRDLGLDMFGSILNWPTGFMGDAAGELEAAAKARLRRLRNRAAE